MADDEDDKCMRLQKAAASVCGDELTDGEVREALEEYSSKTTRTEDAVGARFTHRVAVAVRRGAGWPVYISILEAVHDGYKDLFEE